MNERATEMLTQPTVLHSAMEYSLRRSSYEGRLQCVKELLEAGADVNLVNRFRETPLHIAAEFGLTEFVEIFTKAGADVNQADGYGRTPLHQAACRAHVESVQFLVCAGANVNQRNHQRQTPLHSASWHSVGSWSTGNVDCVKFLIESGADVNARAQNMKTPLQYAVEDCNCDQCSEIIEVLVMAGEMALSYAAYVGRCEEMKTLLKKGAKVNVEGSEHFRFDLNIRNARRLNGEVSDWKPVNLLLLAAGERLIFQQIPNELEPRCHINLMNICRESIAEHLLKLDWHTHLFVRVPRLPLPKALQSYLLYNLTLDDVAEETDESSAEAGSASESVRQGAKPSTA